MDKQIYFMHCWFAEQIEQVAFDIDNYGYGRDEAKIGEKGLEPIERRGYKVIWWYLPGSLDYTTEKEPLFTNIEFNLASDDYHSPTEVKITCSDNPYLHHYLADLAVFLWSNLGLWDQELLMQHPDTDPYFKSLVDYVRNKIPENDLNSEKSVIKAQKSRDIYHADSQYDFDITFRGTKEQFFEFLRNFNNRRTYSGNNSLRWTPDYEHFPHLSRDIVFLWDQAGNHKTLSFIKIQSLPNNWTLLIVHIFKKSYKELEAWGVLKNELDRQGWSAEQDKPDKPDVGATNEDWLNYYHNMKSAGYKITLRQISEESHRNYDNIRKDHQGCPICNKPRKSA